MHLGHEHLVAGGFRMVLAVQPQHGQGLLEIA